MIVFVTLESSLVNIANLTITNMQIKFAKNGCTPKFIKKVINRGNGKFVLDSDYVQSSIINTKPVGNVFFF